MKIVQNVDANRTRHRFKPDGEFLSTVALLRDPKLNLLTCILACHELARKHVISQRNDRNRDKTNAYYNTPDQVAKRRKRYARKMARMQSDPEYAERLKRRHRELTSTPEAKAKKQSRSRAYRSRPGFKERQAELHRQKMQDPEFRKKEQERSAAKFQKNKLSIYERRRNWPEATKAKNREWLRNWMANKRTTDPQYNIRNRLCSRLWHALAYQGVKKAKKTAELVGCSIQELRAHLESKFSEGMNWERFLAGDIHIDHIRPCASFDLTDEAQQKECFNWRNLQPLWEEDNLSKRDSVIMAPA